MSLAANLLCLSLASQIHIYISMPNLHSSKNYIRTFLFSNTKIRSDEQNIGKKRARRVPNNRTTRTSNKTEELNQTKAAARSLGLLLLRSEREWANLVAPGT